MGRAARVNSCSYDGGKRLSDVVTARIKRQLQRDGSPAALALWLQHARFTAQERTFVRDQALHTASYTVHRAVIDEQA